MPVKRHLYDLNKGIMTDDSRFADPGTRLSDLATHFVVCCPKCAGKALINPIGEQKQDFRFACASCFHVEDNGHWYGATTAFVSVKCRECHTPLQRRTTWDGRWKQLAMHCDQCGDDCLYDAHFSRQTMHDGRMTDPVFGLPLWLQKEFRDELLWAYNYEHLALLRQYITAKLRERGINPYNSLRKNSAMLSRLPVFITKAANREGLLKLIAVLEKQ